MKAGYIVYRNPLGLLKCSRYEKVANAIELVLAKKGKKIPFWEPCFSTSPTVVRRSNVYNSAAPTVLCNDLKQLVCLSLYDLGAYGKFPQSRSCMEYDT